MRLAQKNREYQNILVVRFSSLGDIVLTTPVLEGLRRRFPNANISYLAKAEYTPLLADHPSKCLAIGLSEEIRGDSKKYLDLIESLSKQAFDLVVDLQANGRSMVLRKRLGADYLLVKKRTLRRIMIVKFKIGAKGLPNIRDRFFEPLSRLGIPLISRPTTSLHIEEGELREARARFNLDRIERPLALIHSGARWPLKQWGEAKFDALAKMLLKNGFSVAFIGTSRIEGAVSIEGTNLRELVACISLADIFIGNDSGPLHIAEAIGTPSVGIFGPTHEVLGYSSDRPDSRIIGLDLKCRPCSLYGGGHCRTGGRECMEKLTPEAVFEEVKKCLDCGGGCHVE